MDEHSLFKEAFNWLLGTVLTISLFIARLAYSRAAKRQDDQEKEHKELEERVRSLEKESVTHQDLQRIEDKFDKLVDRLDRILERG